MEWLDVSTVPVASRDEEAEAPGGSTELLSVQDAFLDGEHITVQWSAPPNLDVVAVVEREAHRKATHGGKGPGTAAVPVPAGKGTALAHVETLDGSLRSSSAVVLAPQGIPSGPPGVSEADYREALAEGGASGLGRLFDLAFRVGEVQESWLYDLLAFCDISLFFRPRGETLTRGIGSATSQVPLFGYATGSPELVARAVNLSASGSEPEVMDDIIEGFLERESRRVETLRKKRDRPSVESACSRLLIILIYRCLRAESRSAAASKGIRRLHNLRRCWTDSWRISELIRGLEDLARITPSEISGATSAGPSRLAVAASEAGRAMAGDTLERLSAPSGEHISKLKGSPVTLERAVVGPYGDWVGWYDSASQRIWS